MTAYETTQRLHADYPVHAPTNAIFINVVKSFKFTLKYTIISPLHVSVFNDHHPGSFICT